MPKINVKENNTKLVIWIPGFNDTFNHNFIVKDGIFSEMDIHLLHFDDYDQTHEKPYCTENFVLHINNINIELDNIKFSKYDKVILYGHSTGCLIAMLYLKYGKYNQEITHLIMNDPFFEFNIPMPIKWLVKNIYYYPATWKFNSFTWKFDKNSVIDKAKISKYKVYLNYLKYHDTNITDISPTKYAAFLLASSRAQKYLHNTSDTIFGNFKILVFVAGGNHFGAKLNKHDTKKHALKLSKWVEIVEIDKCHHDIFFPDDISTLKKVVFPTIQNYIDSKNNTVGHIRDKEDIEILDNSSLWLPNIIMVVLCSCIGGIIYILF